jgi:pyruvate dehydrogenase E2 component (dihydrolipoamide acetyltransferase)
MIEKIVVPDIGENVVSGKVVSVHVKTGDRLAVDDTVVELETDKAVVEIPSTVTGKVIEVLASEGDELKVGDVIVSVETETRSDDESEKAPSGAQTDARVVPEKATANAQGKPGAVEAVVPDSRVPQVRKDADSVDRDRKKPEQKQVPAAENPPGRLVPASPAIRRLARELGVSIDTVEGSGPGGRITEADVKLHVRHERESAEPARAMSAGGEPQLPDFSRWGQVETVALETVRRLTAESTTTSWLTIPHVTQFDKADITALEDFLNKNADKVARAGGKLTLTPVVTRVCAEALKKYPRFNASLDLAHQRLIFKHYVHIGMAVDTPRGLLMPVIRDADTKCITDLAAEIVDLAERARNKKIKAAELEGGTFSISNQGGIGGVGFTPIILWPQVAILGISRSAIEPKFVEGQFKPQRMLPLSLSYDHRVIDGADAARFLRWICDCLEQPMTMQL